MVDKPSSVVDSRSGTEGDAGEKQAEKWDTSRLALLIEVMAVVVPSFGVGRNPLFVRC